MSTLFVVLGDSDINGRDVYGIFNSEDDAERFIAWAVENDELAEEDDFSVRPIVPATGSGLL